MAFRTSGPAIGLEAREAALALVDIFNQAVAHHQAGRLPDAETLYLKILQEQPAHADSLHLLGVVAHQRGQNDKAVELIRRAIAINGASGPYFSNLGVALRGLGRLPEAVAEFQRAVALAPAYVAAHKNLAVTLGNIGRHEEAVRHFQRALELAPNDLGTVKSLGAALAKLGRREEALGVFAKAIEMKPDDPEACNNLGAVLNDLRRFAESEKSLRKALSLSPNNAEVHNNLGLALGGLGRLDESVQHLSRAVAIAPNFAMARNNLGVALKDQGKLTEALAELQRALKADPNNVAAHNNLGDVLNSLARYDDAVMHLKRALELDPNCYEAHNNLGVALSNLERTAEAVPHLERSLQINPRYMPAHVNFGNALISAGRTEDGTAHFREAIELDANSVGAYYALATNSKHKFTEEQIGRLESLLAAARSPDDRALLNFALAYVLDKTGRYDEAFGHCRTANDLKKTYYNARNTAFDPDAHVALVDRIISTFTPEFFRKAASWGVDSALPVFIVGMPRSSTTLVEQIISSHPAVLGAGELSDIERLASEIAGRLGTTAHYPECLSEAPPETMRKMAEDHVRHLQDLGGKAARVADKMTVNFLHLGLIAALFPKARIIHCIRDARDICVSCYFHNFARAGLAFAFDLEHIGVFYTQYERVMAHWRKTLPLAVLDMPYEELVHNQEACTRKLIEFCGLEWDPRCLAFHKNPRPVKTASVLQVREPMYSSSVGRWKRYEQYLKPFLDRANLK